MRPSPTSLKPYTLIALRHSGTHLIQPIMRSLTDKPVSAPKGESALAFIPSAKCIVFLRDPRNIVVSHMRYKNAGIDTAKADKRLLRLLTKHHGGDGPIEHMTKWAKRWMACEGALVVRFETLIAERQSEVTRIRDYLGVGDVDAAITYAFGTSVTYTGRHSQWREWFGPQSLEAWKTNGGPDLVRLMGYSDAQ